MSSSQIVINPHIKNRTISQTKKSSLFLNGQHQKHFGQTQVFCHELLQQVSEKYIQEGQQNIEFNSEHFIKEVEPQESEGKQQKIPQKTVFKEDKTVEKEKNTDSNGADRKASSPYGRSQSSYKPQSSECKQSDANKILESNPDADANSDEDEDQKQNMLSGYYHDPYTKMMSRDASSSIYKKHNHNSSWKHPKSNFQTHTHNNREHQLFLKQVESMIFAEVKTMELKLLKSNYILEHITDDLQIQAENYQLKISLQPLTPEQLLKTRMHIQSICKIMVFVHGKSQYRLVHSHYYIGQAYRINGCYEQAVDHFTIALKKNAKLTQIKQTKIYHSFILTSLSECYFEIELYDDALQILLRAYQIQQCYVNSQLKVNNIKTIRLISQCYLKMKNYRQAIDYMEKICLIVQKLMGNASIYYAEVKFQKAVIIGEEGNRLGAIDQVKAAIELVQSNSAIEPFEKNMILLEYNKKLAEFFQKFGDFGSQVDCLRQMLKTIDCQKGQSAVQKHHLLQYKIAIKKKIIVISVRYNDLQIAINQLEKVLSLQEQQYGSNSLFVARTLKMLGLVHLHSGNDLHAEQYFKRCYKLKKQSKQVKGEMKDIERIFKLLGYGNRQSLKRKVR